ncbi:MAG TPA: twin-arginine translocase TatA/TatE family subunit [Acidimicrobiales bacterium]|nr:twin-arginine translocase TatA/TatE family subunit [Acidimicrobiales bacterium]
MAGIGAPELIIVLLIALLLFGGAKLPKLARSLGEAQKEFKSATDADGRPVARTPEERREDELARREADLRRREDAVRGEDDTV